MQVIFEALADDTRRRIVEMLATGPRTAGEVATAFSISRPGVSRHLRVLREAGLVAVRGEAQRRIYSLEPEPLAELDRWLHPYRTFWNQRLDALGTEVRRGHRTRATTGGPAQPRTRAEGA